MWLLKIALSLVYSTLVHSKLALKNILFFIVDLTLVPETWAENWISFRSLNRIFSDPIGHTQMNEDEFTGSQGCWTNMTNAIDQSLNSAFGKLGMFCAMNPIKVLVMGLVLTVGLGFGLAFHQITTDPVELWSSPTSQARIEKNYFDENFGKFFRTEQMIISLGEVIEGEEDKPLPTLDDISYDFQPPSASTTDDLPAIKFDGLFRKEVLHALIDIQLDILDLEATRVLKDADTGDKTSETIKLQDICLKPLAPVNNNCTIMSVTGYFQNSHENLDKVIEDYWFPENNKDFHSHLINCVRNPTDIMDELGLQMSCLASFGGPINPNVGIGSFDGKNFLNGTHAVISIPVMNDPESAAKAIHWEKEYLSFIQDFISSENSTVTITGLNPNGEDNKSDWARVKFKVAYNAERSVEDEIERESGTDVTTVLFSYVVMFAYVSFALGQFSSFSRIFIDSKITVGFVGVAIVMASIVCSLGMFSYFGVKMTLIIIEVLPFLVLAVGVDNIFILVQHLQRDRPISDKETVEQQISRVLAEVGPSMFLSSGSETVAFFIGALSTMPAVRSFSMFAGAAVFFDFILQELVLIF